MFQQTTLFNTFPLLEIFMVPSYINVDIFFSDLTRELGKYNLFRNKYQRLVNRVNTANRLPPVYYDSFHGKTFYPGKRQFFLLLVAFQNSPCFPLIPALYTDAPNCCDPTGNRTRDLSRAKRTRYHRAKGSTRQHKG